MLYYNSTCYMLRKKTIQISIVKKKSVTFAISKKVAYLILKTVMDKTPTIKLVLVSFVFNAHNTNL